MSVVLDLGANIECDEKNLVDFSEMGAALYKSIFPNHTPKVSLLNIGSEEIKGTEILKSYSILKKISKRKTFYLMDILKEMNLWKERQML